MLTSSFLHPFAPCCRLWHAACCRGAQRAGRPSARSRPPAHRSARDPTGIPPPPMLPWTQDPTPLPGRPRLPRGAPVTASACGWMCWALPPPGSWLRPGARRRRRRVRADGRTALGCAALCCGTWHACCLATMIAAHTGRTLKVHLTTQQCATLPAAQHNAPRLTPARPPCPHCPAQRGRQLPAQRPSRAWCGWATGGRPHWWWTLALLVLRRRHPGRTTGARSPALPPPPPTPPTQQTIARTCTHSHPPTHTHAPNTAWSSPRSRYAGIYTVAQRVCQAAAVGAWVAPFPAWQRWLGGQGQGCGASAHPLLLRCTCCAAGPPCSPAASPRRCTPRWARRWRRRTQLAQRTRARLVRLSRPGPWAPQRGSTAGGSTAEHSRKEILQMMQQSSTRA